MKLRTEARVAVGIIDQFDHGGARVIFYFSARNEHLYAPYRGFVARRRGSWEGAVSHAHPEEVPGVEIKWTAQFPVR